MISTESLREVAAGTFYKQADFVHSWNIRFYSIFDNASLKYYSKQADFIHLKGTISLSSVELSWGNKSNIASTFPNPTGDETPIDITCDESNSKRVLKVVFTSNLEAQVFVSHLVKVGSRGNMEAFMQELRQVESLPLEKRLSFAESNIICGNESLVDEVMSDVETLALDGYESDTRESIVGGTPLPGPIFELLKSPFKDNNAILKTSKSRLEEQSAQREITTERFRELKKIFAQPAPDMSYLFENNRKWAASKSEKDPKYFERMTSGQKPRFLIIGCADSRVPLNEILGLQPGECFIHRNVANLVVNGDMNILAVLQYAVEYLEVQDIIVCGHYFCGGIKAASTDTDHGLIEHWLRNIRDIIFKNIEEIRAIDNEEAQLKRLVELSIHEQCLNLYRNPIVQNKQRQTGIYPRIHGMVYDLNYGLIAELKINFAEELEKNFQIYGVICKSK